MIEIFQRHVLHNFWLKLLSLVMATALWAALERDPVAEVAIQTPIVFLHVPANLEINVEKIPEAQIRVRGPERVVRRLLPNDIHAELELGDARPGERTFDLSAQQVRHPRELAVVQVVPSQVHLAFDTRMTREVEIHARVTGNFMAGEQIGKVLVEPGKILVSGPRQHVERVEAALTDPVDASGTVVRATFVTNAYVTDPLVQVVQPSPIHVTVIMEKTPVAPAK